MAEEGLTLENILNDAIGTQLAQIPAKKPNEIPGTKKNMVSSKTVELSHSRRLRNFQ